MYRLYLNVDYLTVGKRLFEERFQKVKVVPVVSFKWRTDMRFKKISGFVWKGP